jgi:FkbM family methyltransferase
MNQGAYKNLILLLRKLTTLVLKFAGQNGLVTYCSVINSLDGKISTSALQKLSRIPLATKKDTLIIKSTSGNFKYKYLTNLFDDLNYDCRIHFRNWELVSRYFFNLCARDTEIIFDIGAYTGIYSLEAAKGNPECKIYAFEPNPDIFNNLRENVLINSLENQIKLYPLALGDMIGNRNLYLSEEINHTSTASLVLKSNISYEIEVTTIDSDFSDKEVQLIKVDVEGFESNIFKGGEKTLNEFKPIILSEANSLKNLETQKKILQPLGYISPIRISEVHPGDKRNYAWCTRQHKEKVIKYLEVANKFL